MHYSTEPNGRGLESLNYFDGRDSNHFCLSPKMWNDVVPNTTLKYITYKIFSLTHCLNI